MEKHRQEEAQTGRKSEERSSEGAGAKVRKLRKTVSSMFFQCPVAPEGRKVSSLKRRVRRAIWQMRDEQLHAVVARRCAKHISKQKVSKTGSFRAFLTVKMSKRCTPLWHEEYFQVKMYKTPHVRDIFGCPNVEKVHAGVAKHTLQVKSVKNWWFWAIFDVQIETVT